uniref:4Fe-4S Wbl-type domain-containing protein n=1 Tax=Mycolicibacterium gilvum (strain PYR-GCK) TaxID=350054 RepID=A4TCV2_MYCGI|nr:hypothetical protein Mflv_3893 [Mycolicibacterium gilvum PYR-GCK]
MTATSLFDAVGLAPSLPGAKCRGRHHLFDAPEPGVDTDETRKAEQIALRLCSECPSLGPCRTWLESLPKNKRPLGVVGGAVNTPRRVGRPRKRGNVSSRRPEESCTVLSTVVDPRGGGHNRWRKTPSQTPAALNLSPPKKFPPKRSNDE